MSGVDNRERSPIVTPDGVDWRLARREGIVSAISDLTGMGPLLMDTEDMLARSTLTGNLVDSIATAGTLGLNLVKQNDFARPELITVPGVLNNRHVLAMHSRAKIQGAVTLRNRPAVWIAVVQRILYNKIAVGASVGDGVQITLEEPLQTKVWENQQMEIVGSNAVGSTRVGRFTFRNNYDRGETVVVGDLIDGDVTSSHYFTTRNSAAERIMRTDASGLKDYLNDSGSNGLQPTNRRFVVHDATNQKATDTTNDSLNGPFLISGQFASAADGGNRLRVNGVEVASQSNSSSGQIGGVFSIGGPSSGVKGTARVYGGRYVWFDAKFNDMNLAGSEAALGDDFGIPLP